MVQAGSAAAAAGSAGGGGEGVSSVVDPVFWCGNLRIIMPEDRIVHAGHIFNREMDVIRGWIYMEVHEMDVQDLKLKLFFLFSFYFLLVYFKFF